MKLTTVGAMGDKVYITEICPSLVATCMMYRSSYQSVWGYLWAFRVSSILLWSTISSTELFHSSSHHRTNTIQAIVELVGGINNHQSDLSRSPESTSSKRPSCSHRPNTPRFISSCQQTSPKTVDIHGSLLFLWNYYNETIFYHFRYRLFAQIDRSCTNSICATWTTTEFDYQKPADHKSYKV